MQAPAGRQVCIIQEIGMMTVMLLVQRAYKARLQRVRVCKLMPMPEYACGILHWLGNRACRVYESNN